MRKTTVQWTMKKFMAEVKKGTVKFDYPIQRAGGQWDNLQKSVLIHSLAEDFPVPPIYAIEVEEAQLNEKTNKEKTIKVLQVLDGKQRLNNVKDFTMNEYVLHDDTPNAFIDGEEYVLAGKTFDELDEEVRDAIMDFSLPAVKLENATDEQIEDIFFRLNNGTPLSKQQKAKAKMGSEWAGQIKELVTHDLMKNKASFTELQLRKADDEMAILQTMMLLDENYEMKSISSNDVFDYSQTFKNNDEKKTIGRKIVTAMDYLDKAFQDKENLLLKKIHFPMTIITALKAIEKGIHTLRFNDWKEEFKLALRNKSEYTTNYKKFGGAGSVKKAKTEGRIEEMEKHLILYFQNETSDSLVETEETPGKEKVKVVDPVEKVVEPTDIKTNLEEVKDIQEELEDTKSAG